MLPESVLNTFANCSFVTFAINSAFVIGMPESNARLMQAHAAKYPLCDIFLYETTNGFVSSDQNEKFIVSTKKILQKKIYLRKN